MKTTVSLCFALAVLTTTHAQIFRPEAANGAVLGAIAGAVIGNNSGSLNHNPWQGAAIGAGAGLLLGQLVGQSHYVDTWDGTQAGFGAGYGNRYGHGRARAGAYIYREPQVVYARSYGYDDGYARTDYRGAGVFWGGLLGAIIGHNSGDLRHNGWRGAAIGAGAGLLLGSIAENNARQREAVIATAVPATPAVQAAPTAAPQNVTIINNNYYNTPAPSPMAPANGLFGR